MSGESKELIELLNKTYKLGGMPLVIVSIGFLVSSGGTILEGYSDNFAGVDPIMFFLFGGLMVFFGGFMWFSQAKLKQELQLSMISVTNTLIEGAGSVANDGANYQVALDSSLPNLPKVLELIRESNT